MSSPEEYLDSILGPAHKPTQLVGHVPDSGQARNDSNSSMRIHPGSPLSAIAVGYGADQEYLIEMPDAPPGDEGGGSLPSGVKTGQMLIWNHSKKQWEVRSLSLNISGATLQLVADGLGVIASGTVSECS